MTKIDCNVRTALLSQDSLLDMEACFRRAKEVGLDGVVLVEKNVLRPMAAFAWAQEVAASRFGLRCFQGMYLNTTLGPILLYGQPPSSGGLRVVHRPDTLAALEWAEEQGWTPVLASPFRYGVGPDMGMCARFKGDPDPIAAARREIGYVVRKCHAIEINGCAGKSDNDLALGLATEFRLPHIVGSGAAHAAQMRRGAWTKFPTSARTNEELGQAITKEGRKGGLVKTPEIKGIYSTGA